MGLHQFTSAVTQSWIRPHGCTQVPTNCSASDTSWQSLTEYLNHVGPVMSSQALCHHHEWQHFQTSGHEFLSLHFSACFFKRKERADIITMFLSCTPHLRYRNWLFNFPLSSKWNLSPILKFVIATYISRKCLPLLWIQQDLLHNCLCKELTSLQRRPVLPRLPAPSLCSSLYCPARSYTALAAPGLLKDINLVPVVGICGWQWRV